MEKDTENISDNISENSNVRGAAAVDVRFSRSNSLNSASGENGLKEGGYAKSKKRRMVLSKRGCHARKKNRNANVHSAVDV